MPLRVVVFISLATLILFGLHYYVYVRIGRYLALSGAELKLLQLTVFGLFAGLWLAMPGMRLLQRSISTPVAYAAYGWLGTLVLFALVLLLSDFTRLGVHLSHLLRGEPPDLDRRLFIERLLGLGSLGLTGLLSGYALWQGTRAVSVKRLTVPLKKLPESLRGFRIVQLTDVHIGPTLDGNWLRKVVDKVNSLKPDVVAITGDLVDGTVSALGKQVAPLVDLKSKYGVYFVTGNHEYYSGVTEWLAELARLNIRALRNERVSLPPGAAANAQLDLAGVDDAASGSFPGHGPDVAAAMKDRDPAHPVVLLAHQPITISDAAKHGVDLQLSGHTHGGQLFPWGLFVRLQQPYIVGLHDHQGTKLYVSCGTGYWGPPMRLASTAEITEVTLVPDTK